MDKYRAKPITVEAFQWESDMKFSEHPDWFKKLVKEDKATQYGDLLRLLLFDEYHTVRNGEYVIRGVFDVIETCKPDIFEETYEEIE